MTLRRLFLFPAAAALIFSGALSGQALKDDTGTPYLPPHAGAQRIVSLAPNITEILFALGLEDRIVGVTRYCDFPAEALGKPKVGGLVDPSLESIKLLKPDLVIAYRGNPLRVLERLRRLGCPVFVLDIGTTLESLSPLIARIGALTRKESQAEALQAAAREKAQKVARALQDIGERPKVFFALHGQGLWTCGGGGYLDDLVERAGGRNIAGGVPKKWLLYNREQLVLDDPDVILILARSRKDFLAGRAKIEEAASLRRIRAVREGRIYHLDENSASRFGPRLLDVLAQMASILHPDRFQ